MHCVKVPILGVILARIQSECGKIRTRITPNTYIFYVVMISEQSPVRKYQKILQYGSPLVSFEITRSEKIFFFSPNRLSGGKDVTSDKVNFRLYIRQNCFWRKSGHQEFEYPLKQFGATVP